MNTEDTLTLAELMLHAEQLCATVEAAIKDTAPVSNEEELRSKIGQCRNMLAVLQDYFNQDALTIKNVSVCAAFRSTVISLLWICFYARTRIDLRTFRMLVSIEAGFTYLLCRDNRD
jgi:hypothetical protein